MTEYSPRNPRLFEPRAELMDVLDRVIRKAEENPSDDLAAVIADALLDERETIHVTERMPRGFQVLVTIQPVPNAIILKGLELIDGHKYTIVARVNSYRRDEEKTQTFRSWTWHDNGSWRGGGFSKDNRFGRGPQRWWREMDVVSIEDVTDA